MTHLATLHAEGSNRSSLIIWPFVGSLRSVPPIDGQIHTRHPPGVVARQEHRCARDVIWGACAAERMERIKLLSRSQIRGCIGENCCPGDWLCQ